MYNRATIPNLLLVTLSTFLANSCTEESSLSTPQVQAPIEEPVREFPEVDPELWPYFERFEEEGAERGIEIDLVVAGISGIIESIDEEHVAGICSFIPGRTEFNEITVDQELWDQGSDLFKEFIIFHELGHCFLEREHRETADEQGRCISIMRSGNGTCRDNYSNFTRAEFINELFFPEDI